eukprot:5023910-Lingulodinium_polyedra.AAC.1
MARATARPPAQHGQGGAGLEHVDVLVQLPAMLHPNRPLPPVDVDFFAGPDLDGPGRQCVQPHVGTLEVRPPQVLGDEPLLK